MDKKNTEVSYDFGDAYKGLPLEARVRVNMAARELLEIQKGNDAFCDEGADRFAEDDGEDGEGW